MQRTFFTTPIITSLARSIARVSLTLTGWKIVGSGPVANKCVIIGAPHTSNWDFAVMLAVVLIYRIDVHWMGKDSLFPAPFRRIMQWLGGIPVDRSQANRAVAQMVEQYQASPELRLVITPEGTRRKVERWKSGFYHIALQAQVPILLGYVDYAKKEAGIGSSFQPTGNYGQDVASIQEFYSTRTPRFPELF